MRVALLLLAACGSNTPNAMIGRPHALETIGAPHEAIFVETTRGAYRIWLDTGEREQITGSASPTLTTAGVAIYREDGHYVVEHGKRIRTVPDVSASIGRIELSPDETRFAVAEASADLRSEQAYITVVSIADLTYRRYATTAQLVRWTSDGAGLWIYDMQRTFRLDVASGAIVEMPREHELDDEAKRPDRSVCEARGWRLTRIAAKKRQEIWLEPFARREDPEHLASLERRLLVSSTNNPDHNTTHFRNAGPDPGELTVPMFTRSCGHFVFTLGDSVYVGSVATGHYAHLIVGGDPMFAR